MSRLTPFQRTVFALVAVALILGIYSLQVGIDSRFGEYRSTEDILYVENGQILKRALLNFSDLAADIYWLRAVQYYGGTRRFETEKRFDLLDPLLQITTDLDPRLTIAYSYGAIFLSEAFPGGAGAPLKGVALVDKGIRANPTNWRLYLDKGFIYYWHLQDYKKAADTFFEGSKIPGAPYWMVAVGGRALTLGGDRETARHLWRVLYETAENDQMRSNALTHLEQLDALNQMDGLYKIVSEFRTKHGHFPKDWQEVVRSGSLPGVPVDPTGVPYVLDEVQQRVTIGGASALRALPER